MFRFLKRGFLFFIIISLFAYCFKGSLYRYFVKYKEIKQRNTIQITDKTLLSDLDFSLKTENFLTVEEILNFAYYYTTDDLNYTFDRCSVNPNQILLGKQKSNCVGYSAAFQAVLSYLLEKKGFSSKVSCENKVAQLYFLGFNVHSLFKSPAFKDHDYNVIFDKATKKKWLIDPTLKQVFGISEVNGVK
jgi:hypothetical protein